MASVVVVRHDGVGRAAITYVFGTKVAGKGPGARGQGPRQKLLGLITHWIWN